MMYLLCFTVPETHLDMVKHAVFETGAGKVEHYAQCAWQTQGEGQFLPLEGSNAFIGEVGKAQKVMEYKVEIVCSSHQIKSAVAALKLAHPYETPAYQVILLEEF